MKQSRFTEEQIVAILAEADRGENTIGDVCRAHGVSAPTLAQLAEAVSGDGGGGSAGVPRAEEGERTPEEAAC
jgi:transposase-like protein